MSRSPLQSWPLLLGLLAVVTGCGVDPVDGQFLCPDGECPSGQVCVNGTCRDPGVDAAGPDADAAMPDADARIDAGDASMDGDAGPADETCAPNAGAAVDEDRDGIIDETCGFMLGRPHLVPRVHTGRTDHFTLSLTADGREAYFADNVAGSPVHFITRDDVGEPFANPPVPLMETAGLGLLRYVSVNEDATVMAVQLGDSMTRVFQRPTPGDQFESFGSDLEGVHPAISPNGRELYLTNNMVVPSRIVVRARSDISSPFGAPRTLTLGGVNGQSVPQLTSDGNTLLYVQNAAGVFAAVRREPNGAFVDPVQVMGADGFEFFHYNSNSREMWMATISRTDAPTGIYSIFRAQACRDGACPDEPRVPCVGGVLSDDGFRCYRGVTEDFRWGGARMQCAEMGAVLATIHSPDENDNVAFVATNPWTAMNRGIDPSSSTEFRWAGGEPTLFSTLTLSMPEDPAENCVFVDSSTKVWTNRRCNITRQAACEIEQLPRWLP